MPTKPRRRGYPRYIPRSQRQIIKEIALNGHLSNNKLKERLEVTHPVVSQAIKVLMDRGIVRISHIESVEHKDGGKPEKYYALTKRGLQEFINGNPKPEEFFESLLKSYKVRQQSGWGWLTSMSSNELEDHYKLYEQNYIGYASIHGYLLQSPFFNKLYEQWLAEFRPGLFGQNYLKNIIRLVNSPFFEKCYEESFKINDLNGITVVQKVLECLAIHKSITEKQIEQFLNSKQKLIEEKLAGKTFKYPDFIRDRIEFDYTATPINIRRVLDRYTLSESYLRDELQKFEAADYDSLVKKYLEFLSHLVIIKTDFIDDPRYELSLFGIILILAIVTHPHQNMFYIDNGLEKNNKDLVKFYNMISQSYADKLPLVFGKWDRLTKTWARLTKTTGYVYQWFLPVLYQNIEDEFTRAIRPGSVSVTLGGVKEYQETMGEIALHTTARLFELYRGLSLVLDHGDKKNDSDISSDRGDGQQREQTYLFLEQKHEELAALLKYADLGKFVEKLKDNKKSIQVDQHPESVYDSELSVIEKALASEVTFLFYINLARNKFLDYTDGGRYFLEDERDAGYKDYTDEGTGYEIHIQKPIDFLRIILKSDEELKNEFLKWIADIIDFRRKSAAHMEQLEMTIKKWKRWAELAKD